MKSLVLLLVGIFLFTVCEGRKSYEGYQVLSVVPANKASIEFLRHLQLIDTEVDFWTEPHRIGGEVHIMVGPTHLAEIKQLLTETNITHGIHINNVEDQVGPEAERLAKRNTTGQHFFDINDFNTLEDINSWLAGLANQCPYLVYCDLQLIGNSYEGNAINIFKISMDTAGERRSAFWIDATINPREWIATATILQVMNHLVTLGDANALRLIETYDWYFLPVQNPDGYQYTWSDDRLWRKNRSPVDGSVCVGTEPNRNFDFLWGTEGCSFVPCSEIFCGINAASELETQIASGELNRIAPTVNAVFDMHSYGSRVMIPYGNTINSAGETCQRADDHDDLMVVAEATANAIEDTWGTDAWERGNSCEVTFPTSGTIEDYAKGVAGIKYAYRAELRGDSYIISPDQIPLSFQEVYNGIIAMVDTIDA